MEIYKGKVLMREGKCGNIQRKSINEGGRVWKYTGKVLMRDGECGNILSTDSLG